MLISKLEDRSINYSSSVAIPYKTSGTPFEEFGLNFTLVIVLFCVLSWAVYVYLRKKGIKSISFIKEKKIKVIERTKITTRSSILLIQFENQFFLVGQSNDSLTLIAEIDANRKQS